jgi:hypothetical protein
MHLTITPYEAASQSSRLRSHGVASLRLFVWLYATGTTTTVPADNTPSLRSMTALYSFTATVSPTSVRSIAPKLADTRTLLTDHRTQRLSTPPNIPDATATGVV